MAFKSFRVAIEDSDTDVIECPATQEGAAVVQIGNRSASPATVDVKVYRQALGTALAIVDNWSIPANDIKKLPAPISLEAGDKIVMLSATDDVLTASGTFTFSAATPAAVGFTPLGAWDDEATYDVNDVAEKGGTSYISLQGGNLNNDPETETAYWMVLAAKGEDGDPGEGDLSSVNNLSDVASPAAALANLGGLGQGKHTLWIPAGAMTPRFTNGAAGGLIELPTNKNMVRTLDFDPTTQEFAQFEIAMPKSWDEGTVTFQPVWSHPSTTTNFGVVWALQGLALSDDDAMDAAFGTEQTSTDTGGTANDKYIGPESAAITIGGTPAEGDTVLFQVARVPSDGADTMAVDARLHGIKLYLTLNAPTDA